MLQRTALPHANSDLSVRGRLGSVGHRVQHRQGTAEPESLPAGRRSAGVRGDSLVARGLAVRAHPSTVSSRRRVGGADFGQRFNSESRRTLTHIAWTGQRKAPASSRETHRNAKRCSTMSPPDFSSHSHTSAGGTSRQRWKACWICSSSPAGTLPTSARCPGLAKLANSRSGLDAGLLGELSHDSFFSGLSVVDAARRHLRSGRGNVDVVEHEEASVPVCDIRRRPLVTGRVPVSDELQSDAALSALSRCSGASQPAVRKSRLPSLPSGRTRPW